MAAPPKRILALDVLRAIAIFLVLAFHVSGSPLWVRGGWIGVDLFFTLSGYLISGLLFQEYQRCGSLDLKRFYIRRGFKIYPGYWLLLLVTLAKLILTHSGGGQRLLWEFLFIQNYRQGVWWHTWSLAVEEHFYLLFPLLLVGMARWSKNRKNPFAAIPWVTLGLAATALALRCLVTLYVHPFSYWVHLFPTHLRADSLMLGVFLSYQAHFHRQELQEWMARNGRWVLGASLALLAVFLGQLPETPWVHTVGFTGLALASGGLLLSSLFGRFALPEPLRVAGARVAPAVAFVGFHSYSIYLWHLMAALVMEAVAQRLHWEGTPRYSLLVLMYWVGSIVVGILLARAVEIPALKLRDRLFPARSRQEPPPVPAAS